MPHVFGADLVYVWVDAGKKTLEGAASAFTVQKSVASWNDEDWETFQLHAQTVEDIPRAPGVEDIKELPAPEQKINLAISARSSTQCVDREQQAERTKNSAKADLAVTVVQCTLRRTREHDMKNSVVTVSLP